MFWQGLHTLARNKWYLFFFFFLIYLFIYLFMAVLGLRFCARAFSSCGKRGPLFIAVRGPLTVAASLVEEHRLQKRRLSSCGSQAPLLRGMWDLPKPGLEPMSPALAGRFSTTAPPGKPTFFFFCECVYVCFFVWFCLYRFAFTIYPRVLSVQFFVCFVLVFFFRIVFSTCYHRWICLLVWLLSSFLSFLKLLYFYFIFLFMAVLALRFCARASSSCGKWGPLFIVVRGPLIITASLVVEHRLQTRRLSNCGSRA